MSCRRVSAHGTWPVLCTWCIGAVHDHGSSPISRSGNRRRGNRLTGGRGALAASGTFGVEGSHFGLTPGSADDQSRAFQRAIDETARNRTPLAIAPGSYRVGNLRLPANAQLVGVRGATKLILSDSASLLSAAGAEHVTLSGLVLDGQRRRLPDRRGLLHLENVRRIKIADCEILGAGGTAHRLHRGRRRDRRHARHRQRRRRDPFLRCARAPDRAQHDHRRRQQRHPGLARQGRRRRHHRHRQPHRGDREPLRRLRPVRQRGQRVPRRQCDRARQPHPQLRVHGGARQRRLQPPDRRQQHQRRARGRDLCRVRLRGRADRQQHHRRRRDRRLDHQFQRGRTARERAPATSSATCCRSGRPAPTRATAPASASRSRPTPRSPAT